MSPGAVPDYEDAQLLLDERSAPLASRARPSVWNITGHREPSVELKCSFPSSRLAPSTPLGRAARALGPPTLPAVLDALDRLQPHGDLLRPLLILQYFTNSDKHRLLNVVTEAQAEGSYVRVLPETHQGVETWVTKAPLSDDSLLATVALRRPEAWFDLALTTNSSTSSESDMRIRAAVSTGWEWVA